MHSDALRGESQAKAGAIRTHEGCVPKRTAGDEHGVTWALKLSALPVNLGTRHLHSLARLRLEPSSFLGRCIFISF